MLRHRFDPRPGWQTTIAEEGLTYDLDGPADTEHYWNETHAYLFTEKQIASIARQCEELYWMCLEASSRILDRRYGDPGIPEEAVDFAKASYDAGDIHLYSRFDVIYNPEEDRIKLLEYNSDTPTAVVESAVCQQSWIAGKPGLKDTGQLGSMLVDKFRQILDQSESDQLHLAHVDDDLDELAEDRMNVAVLAHAARLAGWHIKVIALSEIFWDEDKGLWLDGSDDRIENLYKLYPWEDLVTDNDSGYDRLLFDHGRDIQWINPAWTMGSSTKLLLPALWDAFPSHPSLLPSRVDDPGEMTDWVKKPFFGREGDGITVNAPTFGVTADNNQPDDSGFNVFEDLGRYAFQEYCPPFAFEGDDHRINLPVLGCWMVGSKFAGLGIRESSRIITDDQARFVPAAVMDDGYLDR